MAGSTNLLQFNPGAANQETDAQYAADSQRAGGAINGQIFNDQLANKLFYQLSTFCTAFGLMMASKGYTITDTDISTLEGQLANVITAADLKANLQILGFSSTTNFNAATSNGFQVTLSGNMTATASGVSPGQEVTFIIIQDGTGGRDITWGTGFAGGPSPAPNPNQVSIITFYGDGGGTLRPKVAGAVTN